MTDAPQRRWLPSLLRLTRRVSCVGFFVASLAFAMLCGRSYSWNDTIYRHHSDMYWHLRSATARIEYVRNGNVTGQRVIGLHSTSMEEWDKLAARRGHAPSLDPEWFGFGYGFRQGVPVDPARLRVVAPHWFFAVLAGAVAFALKRPPRLRFSLRELLVMMTLAALLLGAIFTLERWGEVQILARREAANP